MFIDDYISHIISKMNQSLKVVQFNGDDNVTFCDNKWIKLFNYILIDGEKVYIKSFEENGTVTFTVNVNGFTEFKLPSVVFFVGSQMQTSSEFLIYSNQYEEKVPFIWLNFPAGINSVQDASKLEEWFEQWNNIRLFFVADMDRSQWMAKETIEERTKIIHTWSKEFVRAIKYPYELEGNVQYFYYPIFGKEEETGTVQDIIDGNLSAVSIDFTLNILEDLNCSSC